MKRSMKFAVCLDNSGNQASLIPGKIYAVLPDARAAKDELIRVLDESGPSPQTVGASGGRLTLTSTDWRAIAAGRRGCA